MFLANAATRRPVATGCLIIALLILGVNSFRSMPLENMPGIDVPYVAVITTWAGASPEDIEKDIAKQIEDNVSGVEGLKHINSICQEDIGVSLLEFEIDVDVDVAAQDVREQVDIALSDLPPDADRPVIQKLDINATPVATLFLTGDLPVDEIYDYADYVLSDRFSNLKGVGRVTLGGGNEREVWVELDPDKLVSAGLTTAHVASALEGGVLMYPGGRVRAGGNEYSLRFDADTMSLDAIRGLQVAGGSGARRYISDLGTVRFAAEEVRQRSYLNGEPGVDIKIVKKSDGNTVEVVKGVRKRFEEVNKTLPSGMKLHWVYDEGLTVESTVQSTISDIMGAIMLCMIILFVFLFNIRTTLIVAITMPATMIISLFFLNLFGQTLNTSTLLAIGLSAGILVSNSIVVLENVVRRFNDFKDKWEAARVGTNQMAVSVLASAGTNVVVMLPIAMMGSMVGRFFRPFAIATLIVNLASIFISFTLTPMLCAMFMRRDTEKNTNKFSRLGRRWDIVFNRFASRYTWGLRKVGDNRLICGLVVLASILLFAFTLKVGTKGVGFNLVELDDWGRVAVRVEMPVYYDLERTTATVQEIASMAADLPDLDYSLATVGQASATGGQASEGVYLGMVELVFKSVYERDWKLEDVITTLRERYRDYPDALITVTSAGMFGGSSSTLQMSLSGTDLDELAERARMLKADFLTQPGVADMDMTMRDTKPQIKVTPKRAVLADMGISPTTLGTIVRGNADGLEVADFKEGDRTIDIRVKLKERPGVEVVAGNALPGKDGLPIPLSAVADVEHSSTQIMIYRVDKQRTVCFVGNETPGYAAGTVMNEMKARAEELGATEGEGYEILDSGMSEMLNESLADFSEAILLSVVLTFLTLSAVLESFTRPFIVGLTLPLGLIGVIWAVKFTGMNVSIFVLLGVVMLIGVVVNAAILIVDRMGQLIDGGRPRREAMYEAVYQMFRSVCMTVSASGLGMLPMAFSTGIGAVNRIGIGAASTGGIIVAGLMTITVIPLVYVFFTKNPKKEVDA